MNDCLDCDAANLQLGRLLSSAGELDKVKKIPYARSETHLTEILEDVCSRFKDYAEIGGKIARFQNRPGDNTPLSFVNAPPQHAIG
jgi:hypothetical protein